MSTFLVVVVLLVVLVKLYDRGRRAQRDLPSLGFPGIWSSYTSSVINCFRAPTVIERACQKYADKLFTFSQLGQWVVLAKKSEHVKDLLNASEDVLSMEHAADELLQLQHTVGAQFVDEDYHIQAIKTSLNLNLSSFLPDMIDEMVIACNDHIDGPLSEKTCIMRHTQENWTSLHATNVFSTIICRISNRVFVGPSLCRNTEFCELSRKFTNEVLFGGPIIKFLVPTSLRSVVGSLYRAIYQHHRRMLDFLNPLMKIRRRQRMLSPEEEPNDMLKWLMDTAPSASEGHSDESIAMRMLNVNYVALHTTTKTFMHALYHLAAEPAYIPILREEVESILGRGNPREWTNEKLTHCINIDSFIKESLRLHGLGAIWMPRIAVADFLFSDGTKVPKGYFVATAATAIHKDPVSYPQPEEFQGLRFANARMQRPQSDVQGQGPKGEDDWHYRLTGPSTSFLAFGGGRHVCPGRFFAATEMKCLLAYLVLHYDIRTVEPGVRPADEWFGPTISPAQNAKILFRRRRGLADHEIDC